GEFEITPDRGRAKRANARPVAPGDRVRRHAAGVQRSAHTDHCELSVSRPAPTSDKESRGSRSHENTGTRSRPEVSGRPISGWSSRPPWQPGVHCGMPELSDASESREERIARAL